MSEQNVFDNAQVCGDALVSGNAKVSDNAQVYDNAQVCGDALVSGNAQVYDNALVSDNAKVCGDAWVYGNAKVYDNAQVSGDAQVCGDAWVSGDARIEKTSDYLVVGPAKSSGRFTTAHRDAVIGVRVNCGCFSGTVAEFRAAIEKEHDNNPEARAQYLAFCQLIVANFDIVVTEGEKQ